MLFKDVSNPHIFKMIQQDYSDDVKPVLYSSGARHICGGVYVNSRGCVSAIRALIGPGVKQDFNEKYFQYVDDQEIIFNLPSWQQNSNQLHMQLLRAFQLSENIMFFFAFVPHGDAHMSLWTNWFYSAVRLTEIIQVEDQHRTIYKVRLKKVTC